LLIKIKSFAAGFLAAALLFFACSMVLAQGEPASPEKPELSVYVDGVKLVGGEGEGSPFLQEGRAYLPLRMVAEGFGKDVYWHGNTSTAFIGERKTLKEFLKTALLPVGETMYIWGGGWNKEDTAAGPEALSIGVSPNWAEFASKQTASYNHRNYRYQIHTGLDCTGLIGWAIFNILPNETGYVFWSDFVAASLTDLGLGTFTGRTDVTARQAGDIMSTEGHAWIALGECSDKSVVILHASPPGVALWGTQAGSAKSEAVKLAERYMSQQYPAWYARFPECAKTGTSYLTKYDQFKWDPELLTDPDGYRQMSADELLADLFKDGSK
jgi:hypothetical protein